MQKALFLLFLISSVGYGESVVVNQTKTKLKDLEKKIGVLQTNLLQVKNKKETLHQELAFTEKKMGQSIAQMREINANLKENQKKISFFQHQVDDLTTQLNSQEYLMKQHIRSRYKIGKNQPLKWILMQENPYMIDRVLTFYHYLIQARKKLITQVHTTKNDLTLSKESLHAKTLAQQQLFNQLKLQQQKLTQEKIYHTQLIQSLDQRIENTEQSLFEVRRNKENLGKLLNSLLQQKVTLPTQPLTAMRRKLIVPVLGGKRNFERINQGIKFFANEGEPVMAVNGGKVVFSDWLKGYGLLLIIDHGWGFMSLYAHNQSLFKQKGDTVSQGEQIAAVGHSGGVKENGLYFEIRQKGKAVSPLEWLS